MDDSVAEKVAACVETLRKRVLAGEWSAVFASCRDERADQLLMGAAFAAQCQAAGGGPDAEELAEIHERDGGQPAEDQGWPGTVADKPGLFAALVEFTRSRGNHHSALPLWDWSEVELGQVEPRPEGGAAADLVLGELTVSFEFEPAGDGDDDEGGGGAEWRWSFAGDGVQLWGDRPPGQLLHPDGEPETPEEHLEVAEAELERGELAHAARHVAAALAEDPGRAEWRALLDRIAECSDDPRELFQLDEDGSWFGDVAGQGHVLAQVGETGRALGMVAQVASHVPWRGYQVWLEEWLGRDSGPLDLTMLVSALAQAGASSVGFLRLRPSEQTLFQRWAGVAAALVERPDAAPIHRVIASGVLRRAGQLEAAEQAARTALGSAGEEDRIRAAAASALGLALRARQRFDEALTVFEQAGQLDPDTPARVEQARVLLDAGRLDEADRVLAQDPSGHELEAMRAWLSLRLRSGAPRPAPRPGFLQKLFGGGEPPPEPPPARAMELARRLPEQGDADMFRLGSEWGVLNLPLPDDATANLVRNLHSQGVDGQGDAEVLEVSLSALEAPSGRLALALQLGHPSAALEKVQIEVNEIPEPDPRKARRPVRGSDVLWIYGGKGKTQPRQMQGPPEDVVRQAIVGIAHSPYYLPEWWRRARDVGKSLGPERAEQILAAMVHPPERPADMDAAEWVIRNQLAAALALAHLDSGWEGSRRREVLFALVDGALDWTTDCALVALTELALDLPEGVREIEEKFWQLAQETPESGHRWYLETLAWCYQRLPGIPGDRRGHLRGVLQAIYGEDEDEQ